MTRLFSKTGARTGVGHRPLSQQIALKQTLDSPVPGISAGVYSSLNIDGACWLQYPNDAIFPAVNQEVERILV